ncbi:MAG: hypothetical protein HYV16_06215 [Gammaproteobacteria bacterium]|nr:hypothetical protein [Gammaproteobacteria bacterium]
MHKPLAALALIALSGLAQAEISRPDPRVDAIPDSARWTFNGAVVSGGDSLGIEVNVQTGEETDRIRAGALYQLAAGALFPVADDWAIQATAGIVRDSIHSNVNEGKGQFHKKFVELMPYYGLGRHRFGLGMTYYYSAEFNGNGDESQGDVNGHISFDKELAPTLAYDWFYNESLALGLRYTAAEFDADEVEIGGVEFDADGASVDADSTGVQVSYYF